MKKKNRKKGLTRRLLALMLCCLFVLVSIPAAAMSIEAESSQAVSEENVSAQSEEGAEKSAAVPETVSETGDSQEISESKPESAEETGNENAAEAGNGENTGATEAQPEEKKDEAEQPEATPTETPEETPAEEKSAKDVLYDRLMACTTYEEMEALQDSLTEEEKSLMEQFTEEQQKALEAKMAELGGYGTEELPGPPSKPTATPTPTQETSTFRITNKLENTEVAYVDIKNGVASGLTQISNGQTVTGTATGSGEHGWGALLFFVKPQDGYLLTTFENAAGAACDLYSVTVAASNSMIDYIRTYSDIGQPVLSAAADQGYLGYFGFTYNGNSGSATYTTKAERPQMTVTATAEPSTGVKPGDTVTYTVTIKPGHTSTNVDEVTGVTITGLTINDKNESYGSLTKNSDGNYTTTVSHVVTEADWNVGTVKLKVSASVDYSYTITVKDRGLNGIVTTSRIPSTATVPNTAEVSVPVAPKNPVKYSVTYAPSDLTPPDIIKMVPYDTNEYFANDAVTVNATYGTESPASGEPANKVDDPTNGGTWTFNGWYKDEALTQKAGATAMMVEGGLKFYGKWTFEKYPTAKVTITKTVSGNMSNHNDSFAFDVKGSTIEDHFELKHGKSQTIIVRVGDTITVSEANGNYEPSYVVNGGQSVDGNSVTYKVTADSNQTIAFTNKYEVTIPTGVSLDSLPYIIVLAVVALGGIVLLKTRRIRRDD